MEQKISDFLRQFGRTEDFYSVLSLPSTATDDQIVQKIRQLSLQYHPDRNPEQAVIATEAAKIINQAKRTLLDPQLRLRHDQRLIDRRAIRLNYWEVGLNDGIRYSTQIKSTEFQNQQSEKYEKIIRDRNFIQSDNVQTELERAFQSFNWQRFVQQHERYVEDNDQEINVNDNLTVSEAFNSILQSSMTGNLSNIISISHSLSYRQFRSVCGTVHERMNQTATPSTTNGQQLRHFYQFTKCLTGMCRQTENTQQRFDWLIKLQKFFWYIVRYHSQGGGDDDDDHPTADISDFLNALVLNEIFFGPGHFCNIIADENNFDNNFLQRWQFFKSSLPSFEPPSHMYFAEITENQDGKTLFGWSVPNSDQYANLQYEEIIRKLVESKLITNEQCGDYYLDLMPACKSAAQYVIAMVAAAKWYCKALLQKDQEISMKRKFILKKLIQRLLLQAQAVSLVTLSSVSIRYFLASQALAILTVILESGNGNNGNLVTMKDFIVFRQWLDRYFFCCRFCPNTWVPNILVGEADVYNCVASKLSKNYLLAQEHAVNDDDDGLAIDDNRLVISQEELYYQLYEQDFKCRDYSICQEAKELCMDEFLETHSLDWDHVSERLHSSIIERQDEDGWSCLNDRLADNILIDNISGISGFKVNTDTGEIEILVTHPPVPPIQQNNQKALICYEDLATSIASGQASVFSLDPACSAERAAVHPMQKFRYQPETIKGTKFLDTLFEADYLMKFMSLGWEINNEPPFLMRPIISQDDSSFWNGIPENIRQDLKPTVNDDTIGFHMSRFWIQADYIEIDTYVEGDWINILFGNVKMSVRTHPLTPDENGELVDTVDEADKESPQWKFAENFTKHYDQLAEYAPVFARLKELVKVQHMGAKITNLRNHSAEQLREINENPDALYKALIENQCDHLLEIFQKISSKTYSPFIETAKLIASKLPACSFEKFFNWIQSKQTALSLAASIVADMQSQNHAIFNLYFNDILTNVNSVKNQLNHIHFLSSENKQQVIDIMRTAQWNEPNDARIIQWLDGGITSNVIASEIAAGIQKTQLTEVISTMVRDWYTILSDNLRITMDEVNYLINVGQLNKAVATRAAENLLSPKDEVINKIRNKRAAVVDAYDQLISSAKISLDRFRSNYAAEYVPAVAVNDHDGKHIRILYGGVLLQPLTRMVSLNRIGSKVLGAIAIGAIKLAQKFGKSRNRGRRGGGGGGGGRRRRPPSSPSPPPPPSGGSGGKKGKAVRTTEFGKAGDPFGGNGQPVGKLGPSGYPPRHYTRPLTRKGAEDYNKRSGKGTEYNSAHNKGEHPHAHPVKRDHGVGKTKKALKKAAEKNRVNNGVHIRIQDKYNKQPRWSQSVKEERKKE